MTPISKLVPRDVQEMLEQLADRACADLRADGFTNTQIGIQRAVDMRYAGQGYEITVSCDDGLTEADSLEKLRQIFDAQHKAMFGHSAPEEPVEIVSYRVRGIGKVPPVEMPRFKPTGATLTEAKQETRRVRLAGDTLECPVYRREKLDVGLSLEGPAVLDQFDCTTVIGSGQIAFVDEWKNLIITPEG
jgi:N-methylhydantoinase A